MNKYKSKFDHLIKNLERGSNENSIFLKEPGQKAFLSFGQGEFSEWLDKLLPNTRLVLEPKIIGSSIGVQYIDGVLRKIINDKSVDITEAMISYKNIPKFLPIKKRIEIQGVVYNDKTVSNRRHSKNIKIQTVPHNREKVNFCAHQIFNCNINQYQVLQELKQLNFEIPETHFTNFTSDIEIYRQCWKDGKLFNNYPTSGIVVKINSRKLQKILGENNLLIHWAYAIS